MMLDALEENSSLPHPSVEHMFYNTSDILYVLFVECVQACECSVWTKLYWICFIDIRSIKKNIYKYGSACTLKGEISFVKLSKRTKELIIIFMFWQEIFQQLSVSKHFVDLWSKIWLNYCRKLWIIAVWRNGVVTRLPI